MTQPLKIASNSGQRPDTVKKIPVSDILQCLKIKEQLVSLRHIFQHIIRRSIPCVIKHYIFVPLKLYPHKIFLRELSLTKVHKINLG